MFKEELIPLAPSQNQLRQDIRFLTRLLAVLAAGFFFAAGLRVAIWITPKN